MVQIYTSQFRYSGPDRLDITFKTGDPIFAPTKYMVYGYKYHNMSQDKYTQLYTELMNKSFLLNRLRWDEVLNMDRVTFVCYCPPPFCHRFSLSSFFVKLGGIYNGEITSKGELVNGRHF